MRIITERRLRDFCIENPEAENVIRKWILTVREADWISFPNLRNTFNSADIYGKCVVFNVGGNKYRIIGMIEYQKHLVFIRDVLTHQQYDKNDWKPDCE